MIYMTRRVSFSAGKIDPPLGGDLVAGVAPSDLPEAYGHNYVLDVTVTGEIDPRSGVVVNIKTIDSVVRDLVTDRLDRKSLHRQTAEFRNRPATPESLAVWIAGELENNLPKEVTLAAVHIEETPLVRAEWVKAQPMNMKEQNSTSAPGVRSTRVYEFAASHRLHSKHLTDDENRELFGKCNYPHGHGHNYLLEVTVTGPVDTRTGRVIDPALLDEIVHRMVVDRYDHRHLNYDIPELEDLVPSTEVVTRAIWERLVGEIPLPSRLASVLIRETARNIFEYRGEA